MCPTVPTIDLCEGVQHIVFPQTADVRFGVVTTSPGCSFPPEAYEAAAAKAEETLPGAAATPDPERPDTRTTQTVDLIVADIFTQPAGPEWP